MPPPRYLRMTAPIPRLLLSAASLGRSRSHPHMFVCRNWLNLCTQSPVGERDKWIAQGVRSVPEKHERSVLQGMHEGRAFNRVDGSAPVPAPGLQSSNPATPHRVPDRSGPTCFTMIQRWCLPGSRCTRRAHQAGRLDLAININPRHGWIGRASVRSNATMYNERTSGTFHGRGHDTL
ncbi:hypothetical protein JB92DRAFT_384659 [Gautieria morchelliformis]|nr:hypothetical protein JB92DRAFT_384659 [Gautieria morchelliformis]